MATDDEIEKHYAEARDRGAVGIGGVLRVKGSQDLVIVPKSFIEVERYLREKLEREIDELKTAQSLQWLESRGYLENLVGPEDEVPERREGLVMDSSSGPVRVYPSQGAALRGAASQHVTIRRTSFSDFMQTSAARSKVAAPAGALRHRRKTTGSGT